MSARISPRQQRLAASAAALVICALLSAPWLLMRWGVPLDKRLSLPAEIERRLPAACNTLWLYVGYPGCHSECPRALRKVARSLQENRVDGASCGVFLSLFTGDGAATDLFAKRFHPALIGVSLSERERRSFLDLIGVRESISPPAAHPDFIYTRGRGDEKSGDRSGDAAWRLTQRRSATSW